LAEQQAQEQGVMSDASDAIVESEWGQKKKRQFDDLQETLIEATYSKNPAPHLLACNLRLENGVWVKAAPPRALCRSQKPIFLFRLAMGLRYLDLKRYEFATRAIDEIGRLVGGWLKAQRVVSP
jgi:hypothetical protein